MMLWYFEVGVPLEIYIFKTNHMVFPQHFFVDLYCGFIMVLFQHTMLCRFEVGLPFEILIFKRNHMIFHNIYGDPQYGFTL